MERKIAVLGGGSLGLLLAYRLREAGMRCEIWTRTAEQADRLNSEGVTLRSALGEPENRSPAKALAWEVAAAGSPADVVLLTVKQTALTARFLDGLADAVSEGGTVVAFQNGIGHAARLRKALPGRSVVVAVTTEGALRENGTTVRHTGRGLIKLAGEAGTEAGAAGPADVERLLGQAGFSVFLSNDLEETVLLKLLVNAAINPLTAVLRVANGGLTETSDRLGLMRALFEETHGILKARGFGVAEEECWQEILRVCEATGANRSSMLQDVLAGRPTEIDAINGEIVRMAEGLGLAAPWNRAATAFVKAAERPITPEER